MMEVASGFFGDGSWKLLRKLPVPLAPPDLPACDSNWKRPGWHISHPAAMKTLITKNVFKKIHIELEGLNEEAIPLARLISEKYKGLNV